MRRDGQHMRLTKPVLAELICLELVTSICCLSAAQPGAGSNFVVLAWPPPPAQACIVYVGSIHAPADIGAKPGTFTRVANFVSGAEKGKGALVRPFGLALDDAGNLLVTDTDAGAVCCINRATKKWQRWEQAGQTRFESPVAVARRGDTLFVADSSLGKVFAFGENGKMRFEITNGLARPSGLAIAGEKLFIADAQRHQIVVCDLRGNLISKFGQRGSSPGEFNYPTHVSVDNTGQIYVTDSLSYRVQVFDGAGKFQGIIGGAGDSLGHFSRPKGVAADSAGHVYVVDALMDTVQIFNAAGQLLLNWGENGSRPGEFWLANGIAINRDNEIFVADSYNGRIQIFRYTGKS